MDNLAHTLAGAALAEAGLKRRTGLGTVTLLIAANLPDLDVLSIPGGRSLVMRRGWTHGPLAMILLPLLLTGLVVAVDRWQRRRGVRPPLRPPVRPRQLLLLAAVGTLSHPLLDWMNTYGVRLLMPFSERWFYGDALFIIDPWLWLTLGLGVWLARRREGLPEPARSRPAVGALAVLGAYVAWMVGSGFAAERIVMRRLDPEGTGEVREVLASPVPGHPFRRHLVIDRGDSYAFGELRWLPTLAVDVEPGALPTGDAHPAVAAARRRREMADFLYWSRFPFFTVRESGEELVVHAGDARYASREGGGWASVSVRVPRALVLRNGAASRVPAREAPGGGT